MPSSVKDKIIKFVEDSNRHDLSDLSSLIHKDILHSECFMLEPLRGIEAVKEDWKEFFTMIPDVRMKIENILAEGDRAALEPKYFGTDMNRQTDESR